MKVLIIIPAYNEAGSIQKVVEGLSRVCPGYNYLVVNDGPGMKQPLSVEKTATTCWTSR